MFENTGSKIRYIAIAIFILSIIGSIIIWTTYDSLEIALVVLAVSYIQWLLMNAIGEILENTETIIYKLSESNSSNQGYFGSMQLVGEDYWKCPNCKKINHKTVGTCGCGTRKPN